MSVVDWSEIAGHDIRTLLNHYSACPVVTFVPGSILLQHVTGRSLVCLDCSVVLPMYLVMFNASTDDTLTLGDALLSSCLVCLVTGHILNVGMPLPYSTL